MSTALIGTLLPEHHRELVVQSAIAPDVAAANVASFGAGTGRHWEHERSELVAYARHRIQTESVTVKGLPQAQPAALADRLIGLDRRYRHLQAGGWRTLSETLPGLEPFNQWKPAQSRDKGRRNASGQWERLEGKPIKYEAPPDFPGGGGLLLPRVPDRVWRLICERQGLPFPADRSGGFWAWALATPGLQLLICEGWKKALAAVSTGWAAVALPGVQMGRRRNPDGSERLIEALKQLTPGRSWLIAFDAERKRSTARMVGAAAGCLARALRAAGGRVEIAQLPLQRGQDKTGLDDLLAAAGPEALDHALAQTGPRPVLPWLRPADRIAPAGAWLADAAPTPSPDVASLVVMRVPMGGGKTQSAAFHLAPLAAVGVPVLMPSHRQALGQAAAESLGVPWCPAPGSDERLQGVAGCWDSWCLNSGLRISPTGWSGGVLVLDEWMQALEHLLLSDGTALAQRRGEVLRTASEQLRQMLQILAMDAQMAEWGVRLLERLTGRRAYVIGSDHRPMLGRPLHAPRKLKTAADAAEAFRVQWAQLVKAGEPFLCWTSAQQASSRNAPQTLAIQHGRWRPGDLVDVIDSTTPELAAELAADPDGFAERRMAEAKRLGVNWALYCSPAISSGISFARWKPAAVIAYAGGHIAPEHVAQALARVRCPAVPAWVFAPERCPGAALRVGSGATDPAQLIRDLKAVADPLYGQLEAGDAEGAWLQAWAELGATRNRQHFAYQATIAGLLEAEGWELQNTPPPVEEAAAIAANVGEALSAITGTVRELEDQSLREAALLSPQEAAELAGKRRRLAPTEQTTLDRFRLDQRWGLQGRPLTQAVIEADRDGLRERLRLGWLLTTPEALDLVPGHDQAAIAALDRHGRPFEPDRLRVTLGQRIAALQALGLPALLQRFAGGEVIAATDPAVVALHATATAHSGQLAQALGVSPGAKPTGTLRALLQAIGWELKRAGRVKTRGASRDALTYRAHRIQLPQGVEAQALAAVWLAELQPPAGGALFTPIENPYRGQKCPSPPRAPAPPPLRRWPLAPAVAIPWPAAPPPPRSAPLIAA